MNKRESAPSDLSVNVTTFKAQCLDLFKRLESGKVTRITVTRRGKPVGIVEPVHTQRPLLGDAYGFLKDVTHISPDYDPFERVIDDPVDPFFDKP